MADGHLQKQMTGDGDREAGFRQVTLAELVAASQKGFRTTEERVASVIRSAIVAGIFKPEQRLPQDRVAKLLDVSRMPIRAALRQLESEGLVQLHPHRGATVRALSPEEISDLYEIRVLIETFALRKTVVAITDEQLDELDELAADLEEEEGEQHWMEARQAFYRALYTIGNTPRVVSTIMQFRAEVSRYTIDLDHRRSGTHRDLLDRIRLRDPDLAAAWLETHLREVAQERRREVALATRQEAPHPRHDSGET